MGAELEMERITHQRGGGGSGGKSNARRGSEKAQREREREGMTLPGTDLRLSPWGATGWAAGSDAPSPTHSAPHLPAQT